MKRSAKLLFGITLLALLLVFSACSTELTGDGSQPKTETPTASLPSGTYTGKQLVTLTTATSGARIYYTLNNSPPTINSYYFTGASIPIEPAATVTLKAIAVKDGMINSDMLTVTYNFEDPFDVGSRTQWDNTVSIINGHGDVGKYVINITSDFYMPGVSDNTFTPWYLEVTIKGSKTISLSENGSLLRIGGTQSVILQETGLKGKDSNDSPIVDVVNGGTFTMGGGASVFGNTNTSDESSGKLTGGGVSVRDEAVFTMEGDSKVYGNTAESAPGGGVHVEFASFIMRDDAEVYGNTPSSGCVYIWSGSFTMQDNAKVRDNTAGGVVGVVYVNGTFIMQNSAGIFGNTGGGIRIWSGSLTMQDNARIHDNNGIGVSVNENGAFIMQDSAQIHHNEDVGVSVVDADFIMRDNAEIHHNEGGGVSVISSASFTMQDSASIHENTATIGGGVEVNNASFTMKDNAEITGNEATSRGGGVWVQNNGTFTMEGGVIGANTAEYEGGGVFLVDGAVFTKKIPEGGTGSGTIYGTTAGSDSNEVTNPRTYGMGGGGGSAVFVGNANGLVCTKNRKSTAGPDDEMDSEVDGEDGGWEWPL